MMERANVHEERPTESAIDASWLEGLIVATVLCAVLITIGLVDWALDAASTLTILVAPDFTP